MYLRPPATQYPFQKLSPQRVQTKPGKTKHMKSANQGSEKEYRRRNRTRYEEKEIVEEQLENSRNAGI